MNQINIIINKIIEFMKWRNDELSKIYGYDVGYFNEHDEKYLLKINYNKNAILKLNELYKKGVYKCPFCIIDKYNESICIDCHYGKRHGICGKTPFNTHDFIINEIGNGNYSACGIIGLKKVKDKLHQLFK